MDMAIDNVLNEVAKYSLQDKEMLLCILEKRLIEEKRELLNKDYRKAAKYYRNGNVKTGTVDDLFDSLND